MRADSDGLATTFRVLGKTDNEAAVPVLITALDSPHPTIRDEALAAILVRSSPAGHREILRRLPILSDRWKAIIRQHPSRMTRILRETLLDNDMALCRTACQAAVWFEEYDLVPTLLKMMEDPNNAHADMAAQTLRELAKQLYEQLGSPRDEQDRRDPQTVRRYIVNCLEESLNRWSRHRRREVIEIFLLLVNRDNVTLRRILQNPYHTAFLALLEVLSRDEDGGVLRLLLSFFEDTSVPSAALTTAANRSDAKFLSHLSRKLARESSATMKQNLKRIESIGWLRSAGPILDALDDVGQCGIVRLVVGSGVPRAQAYAAIEHILLHGKPGGRREAAGALADFSGADANALALRALEDADPQVQANVLLQLRRRGIPSILPRIVALVDSRHAIVRKAARESLAEFTFRRFVAAFDMLEDDVRASTGMLVKKIDPQTIPQLNEEMRSLVRSRRIRALTIARVIEAVEPLEDAVVELLHDEDHLVRREAAAALGACATASSREALETALSDRSEMVQQAAERAIEAQSQGKPAPRQFALAGDWNAVGELL